MITRLVFKKIAARGNVKFATPSQKKLSYNVIFLTIQNLAALKSLPNNAHSGNCSSESSLKYGPINNKSFLW